jgi:hypothetical protein
VYARLLTSSPNMFGLRLERAKDGSGSWLRIARKRRSVHIGRQMIATPGRSSQDPLPKLRQQRAEAPEFQVMFSRPADFTGQRPNSFRWSGNGTIHVMERGLLIIARRRSAMAFHTTQERFVPAAEICDVYREGNSVRVDLRGDLQQRDYFQFWTADAATAGTIVRLLPTTRTIEYEGGSGISADAPKTPPPYRRRASVRTAILVALVAVGIASLITVDRLRHQPPSERGEYTPTVATTGSTVPGTGSTAPATGPVTTSAQSMVPQHSATTAEIEAARADLKRFDERIDGLRAQYRMAFAALESGSLSQQDFIEGLDRWLLPQWRALDAEIASNAPEDGSLGSVVRKHLMRSAVGWERALDDYIRGLNDQDAATVMEAFDRMADANQAQRQAWSVINHAER